MTGFRCIGLSILFLIPFAWSGLAQSPTITTYAGSPLPVGGTQATTQAIDYPTSVVPDGSGGFYVPSSAQNRIYRVAADGTLSVVAGTAAKGVQWRQRACDLRRTQVPSRRGGGWVW